MLAAMATVTLPACSSAPVKDEKPLGLLPTAVTTAVPLWIPFSIAAGESKPDDGREKRLASLRQLTTDGKSRGAVWHPDGTAIFFSTSDANGCGRLLRMDLVSGNTEAVETSGWAASPSAAGTKLFFVRGDEAGSCPPSPSASQRRLGKSGAFIASAGEPAVELLPNAQGISVSSDGRQLVFSSTRDGDPDLYAASPAGTNITRLTHEAGFDGAPEVSPDGSKMVWEAQRVGEEEKEGYAAELATGQLAPRRLRIMLARTTGQPARVIADAGTFNTSPSFLPDSERVLFASNVGDADNFDVYLVDPDGPVTANGQPKTTRITFHDGFDGEARMSPDGKYVLFTSSRGSDQPGSTNVFVARWLGD